MDKFYRTSDFKFSPDARQWILDRYSSRFDQNFYHDFDVTQMNSTSQQEWKTSVAGREIIEYLETCGCDCGYYGIGVFISNTDQIVRSNPHYDVRFKNGTQSRIKTRFNTRILGESADQMLWWSQFEYGDTRFIEQKFTALTGQQYTSRSVPGNTVEERLEWLGPPDVVESELLQPSAFVRTDCVHALVLSPVPRLIVTVAIDRDLESIEIPQRVL